MAITQIISAIVSAAARNMKQTGEGERAAEKGYNVDAIKQQNQNMQLQQAPAMPSQAVSPTAKLTTMFTGMSPDQQKQVPVIGGALKGEEAMLQNQNVPMIGGFTVQPKTFNSSQPFYQTKRMY